MNLKKLGIYSFLMSTLMMPLVAADSITGGWEALGSFGTICRYLFGPVTTVTNNAMSAAIITVAVWVLLAITLGDLISSFSTFSAWVSWTAAAVIGIIAANLNWITAIIAWTTGVFAFLGTAAIFAGLFGALAAFVIVNLGVYKLGHWVMARKALMQASKRASAITAGGKVTAASAGAIKNVGKAIAGP